MNLLFKLTSLVIITLVSLAAEASTTFYVDFEDDPVGPQADGWKSNDATILSFASNGGNMRTGAFGNQNLGLYGLANTGTPLVMDFSQAVKSLSLVFGNDDPNFGNSTIAVLNIFSGANLVTSVSVAANNDDIANQSISFSNAQGFDSATFRYTDGSGALSGLAQVVDDIRFTTLRPVEGVPEPASWILLLAGFALTAGSLRRQQGDATVS